jgi:hypothetical protein
MAAPFGSDTTCTWFLAIALQLVASTSTAAVATSDNVDLRILIQVKSGTYALLTRFRCSKGTVERLRRPLLGSFWPADRSTSASEPGTGDKFRNSCPGIPYEEGLEHSVDNCEFFSDIALTRPALQCRCTQEAQMVWSDWCTQMNTHICCG